MFSRFFIERPIFAAVVAIIICLAGLVAMSVMPIQQYPTITPVQVTVSATYPGADSKTLADSVAAPIEAQINGVDNMLYMSSTSSATGQLTLTVYFSLDTDPDIAQVQVQNRVNLAAPQLPTAVTQQGVSVQKKSSSIMMLIGVFGKGDRYSADYIANYANVYVLDALKRVPGAGPAVGCCPICPAPNSAFCALIALVMSVVVMPSEAIRSGFIQIRIAWSGTPMIDAGPAPGTRFNASRT